MTWLTNSSIGRKVVMSVTGAALVLFLLFHGSMNLVAIISEEGYNMICEFLGANWYAIVATMGLAFLMVVHILYAFILSIQNYRARGRERYAVNERQANVEWSSKNMLVLGLIILGFLGVHLYNFWYKMQWVELQVNLGLLPHDAGADAANGIKYIKELFAQPIYAGLYLVWLAALWFHLTHGIWSALHSLGLNNTTWMPRVKMISNIVSTLVVLMFASVVVYYFGYSLGAHCAL
jgi:succinate dehydrogenase / fumarate reductase, cytochrome b subunit